MAMAAEMVVTPMVVAKTALTLMALTPIAAAKTAAAAREKVYGDSDRCRLPMCAQSTTTVKTVLTMEMVLTSMTVMQTQRCSSGAAQTFSRYTH